jgi:hypothetical protein
LDKVEIFLEFWHLCLLVVTLEVEG